MNLLPLFRWFEASHVGDTIRASPWLFPAIECVHLLGLVLLGGSVLLTVRRRVVLAEEGRVGRGLVAVTSLKLWFTVAAGGRWIGFS